MYFSIGIVIFALLISVVVCTGRKGAAKWTLDTRKDRTLYVSREILSQLQLF